MEVYFEQIETLVLNSNLPPEERHELLEVLALLDNDTLQEVLELFQKNATWIEIVYQNFLDKRDAFANNDTEAILDILQSEETLLAQFDGVE